MQNAITTLRIQNFKSIKDVTLHPHRVNIIIGEPNVGKSNILEAMSLLGGMVYDKGGRFMDGIIRYEQPEQLFYDNVLDNMVSVETERDSCFLYNHSRYKRLKAVYFNNDAMWHLKNVNSARGYLSNPPAKKELIEDIGDDKLERKEAEMAGVVYGWADIDVNRGNVSYDKGSFEKATEDVINAVRVRPYLFTKNTAVGSRSLFTYLSPPYGTNLKNIIQSHATLRQEVARLFKPYGQKMLLRMASNEIEIAKEVGDLMYTYPYSSIADTLQRLIFYLAAIASNDDAVLLFEEPEAHSYPVYVSHLAQRVVESRNNQFFIVTHSPYLITEVLESMLPDEELAGELALFVAYYEDYQTKVRQLSNEEVQSIRRESLDVFYNMARFTPRPSVSQD